MRDIRLLERIAFILCLALVSQAKPLTPQPHHVTISQPHASSLTGPPADFKVDITNNPDIRLRSDETYRVAFDVMYDIAEYALDFPWHRRNWDSRPGSPMITIIPVETTGKELSRLTTQRVIWGLNHLMLSMYLSRRYCSTIATLKWQGAEIGSILVDKTQASLEANATTEPQSSVPGVMSLPQNGTVNDEDIEVVVSYRAHFPPIPRELIYLTAIKAVGEAAETGLDTPVQELLTQSIQRTWWKLRAGHSSLTGILRPRHSRITIARTLEVMIGEKRFQALFVGVKVNGENVAVGGFGQGDIIHILSSAAVV